MPAKYNNDEFFELVFGVLTGILAVFLLLMIVVNGDIPDLIKARGYHRSSRPGGIPALLIVLLGLCSLYYSVKKLTGINKKRR